MNFRRGIDAWLLIWWITQTLQLAKLVGTKGLEAGVVFWVYLTALLLGRWGFLAARDALVRRRGSAAASAPWGADLAQCDPLPPGGVRS